MSDVRHRRHTMARAVLRPRRQLTLPRDICRQLGIDTGDQVDLSVEDGTLVVTPSRKLALDALAEIQNAFARSGLTEEELQRAAREARSEAPRSRPAVTGAVYYLVSGEVAFLREARRLETSVALVTPREFLGRLR